MNHYRLTWNISHLDISARCIIGRGSECDVLLRGDKSVSRHHCELTVCAHGVVVRDLGSKNGVRVDGARIDGSLLLIGEHKITVGKTRFWLAPLSEVADASRAEWDEPTLRSGLELETAELFDQVLQVAVDHARAGRVGRAERVCEAHLSKLLRRATAGEPLDEVRLERATDLALLLGEAESPRWLGYVLELHLALEQNLSEDAARRFLRTLAKHPGSVDPELVRTYGEQARFLAATEGAAPGDTTPDREAAGATVEGSVPPEGASQISRSGMAPAGTTSEAGERRPSSRWSRLLGRIGWASEDDVTPGGRRVTRK